MRVVTYNVHKCRGMDGRTRPARIAEVLHSMNADIIALQEVVSIDDDMREMHQARFLAEELGMDFAIGENRRLLGGAYGNVVLSRYPLHAACNYDITVPGRERRGCLRTDIDLGDGCTVHVFNVHLGTAYLERRVQGRLLLADELLYSRELNGPRIVLGDFNEWTHGLASQLLHAEFESADVRMHLKIRSTYPALMPVVHLDHIYYDRSLVLEGVGILRNRLALVASDHLPIWADFAIQEHEDRSETPE